MPQKIKVFHMEFRLRKNLGPRTEYTYIKKRAKDITRKERPVSPFLLLDDFPSGLGGYIPKASDYANFTTQILERSEFS